MLRISCEYLKKPKMKTMRYMIIADKPFYSDWLMQPDWDKVVMIIDIMKDVYVKKEHDDNYLESWNSDHLKWQEINFDHL